MTILILFDFILDNLPTCQPHAHITISYHTSRSDPEASYWFADMFVLWW